MVVYVLLMMIGVLIPLAGIGVCYVYVDLLNKRRPHEVSASVTVERKKEVDRERLLGQVMEYLQLLHTPTDKSIRSIKRKRNNPDSKRLSK